MLLLSASPLFGSLGVVGIALGVCVVLLLMVRSSSHSPLEGPPADPVEDLTYRLHHPVKWTATHPLRAIGRKLVR